jgi:hypothetical protein
MEVEWIWQSRPQWWVILDDALLKGDLKRARFAWRMLREVLAASEDAF